MDRTETKAQTKNDRHQQHCSEQVHCISRTRGVLSSMNDDHGTRRFIERIIGETGADSLRLIGKGGCVLFVVVAASR